MPRELAGVLPQVLRWKPVLAGWILVAGLLAWKVGDADGVTVLRVVAVLLATTVVTLVDDAAQNILASSPTPLVWRTGGRLALAASAVAVAWAVALFWVRPGDLTAALTLEAAALTALALAVASGVARWVGARDASYAAGPAVAGAVLAALVLPPRWALIVPPGESWRDAHLRWAALLVIALAVIAVALRDPAGRPVAPRVTPSRDRP